MTKHCYNCGGAIDEGHGTYTYTILQRANAGTSMDGEYITYTAPIVYLHMSCDVKLFGGCKGTDDKSEAMTLG